MVGKYQNKIFITVRKKRSEMVQKLKEVSRYYDYESINNWSIREYQHAGVGLDHMVVLERCNDTFPTYFRCSVHVLRKNGDILHIDSGIFDDDDWGKGLTWNQAIERVEERLAYTLALEYYSPESQKVAVLDKGDKLIDSIYGAKTSPCWGQGPLGNTGYYQLAIFSPASKGDKQSVFICKTEALPEK